MMCHVIEINRCGTLIEEFNAFNSDLCELVGRSYLFSFGLFVCVVLAIHYMSNAIDATFLGGLVDL